MALPDSAKYIDGTAFVFAYATDWAGGTVGWSSTVDGEVNLNSLADGSYRETAKVDLTANRDVEYKVEVSWETDTDATAGSTVDVYVGYSDSATAGTGNPAGLTGADGAYTGGTGGTAATGITGLEWAGSFICQATQDTDGPQVQHVGTIRPRGRYAMLVIGNNSGATAGSGGAGTADECAVRLVGQHLQLQD